MLLYILCRCCQVNWGDPGRFQARGGLNLAEGVVKSCLSCLEKTQGQAHNTVDERHKQESLLN